VRGEEETRLDPAAFEELRKLGGDEFVTDLTATLLAEAPPLLAALHGTEASEVRRAAHTLKSNGNTFGATRLAALCRELEAGDLTGAPALAAGIEAEYALVAEELCR
jgi:HPt (histidine-containing phosphotransfer) domain-containing protein